MADTVSRSTSTQENPFALLCVFIFMCTSYAPIYRIYSQNPNMDRRMGWTRENVVQSWARCLKMLEEGGGGRPPTHFAQMATFIARAALFWYLDEIRRERGRDYFLEYLKKVSENVRKIFKRRLL